MRIVKVLLSFAAGVSFFLLLAQSDADYQGYMQSVASSNKKFQKAAKEKDGATVATEGAALEGIFKQVEAFWSKRGGAADAVTFAKTAHMAAAAASAAAKAGDLDKAAAEAATVGGACGGCHAAHREKGEGGFKIK